MSTAMPEKPPDTRRGLRRWWWAMAATIVTVAITVALIGLVLTRFGSRQTASPQPPAQQLSTAPKAPPEGANPTGATSTAPTVPEFKYLPLWPFDSVADAIRWQRE